MPLVDHFPDYQGGSDITKATKYILSKFMQANRSHSTIYAQYVWSFFHPSPFVHLFLFLLSLTIATDMTNMAPVLSAVKETIHQNPIRESVLLWSVSLVPVNFCFSLFSLGESPVKTKLKLHVIQLMNYLDAFRVLTSILFNPLMRILSHTLQL